jgi:hypothetical protein
MHICVTLILLATPLLFPSLLFADGGTLRLSQRCGTFQVSVFTSPAVLRSGKIDVSVLVQDAGTGKTETDVPVTIRLTLNENSSSQANDTIEKVATTSAATNKLFQAAVFDVAQPGVWRGSVSLGTEPIPTDGSQKATPLLFDLVVSPPPPAWLELAPWIGWPFGIVAMFLVHQRLASRTQRMENCTLRS